jgi:hypothetical protein
MSQQELLGRVVEALDALGIQYMLTGSVASSIQGEPRSTHDIDLVVALPPDKVDALLQAFQAPEFYLAREAIDDALRCRSMFNLLAIAEGEKVDFWMLTDEPYDLMRFSRKQTQAAFGIRINLCTPEDTILAKLRWAKLSGGSEKQLTDALRVFELQKPRLDLGYIDAWANQLGVADLWTRLQSEAQPL